jgi:HSP20 family protein
MAYYNTSLQDLLEALQSQDRYQHQRQPQNPYARFGQRAPYGGYPFGYYDEEDDAESEDQYSGARYPDYYGSPFGYGRPRRQYTRPQGPPPQQQSAPQQQLPHERQQSYEINSLEDLLNLIAGGQARSADQQTEPKTEQSQVEEPVEKETAEQPKETKEEVKKDVEPEVTKKAESKPKPITKRHSTAKFKEPQPKIEISQRNVKNPQIPYSPQTNVYETESEYTVVLALPGAQLKELDIDFHPATNEVIIKGVVPEPFPTESIKVNEIRTGSIERRVKFPTLPKIQDDAIKANYINGLLTIKVPKAKEEERPKRKVTIEDVPDEELIYEEHGGIVE